MLTKPRQSNSTESRARRTPWLLVIGIAAILATVASFGMKLGLVNLNAGLQDLHRDRRDLALPTVTPKDQNLSVMTDSILSIVQGYYVDPQRVENRELIEHALAAMATNPRVRSGSSPGAVWLQIDDGERKVFPLKKQTNYTEVVDTLVAMARMIDEAGIELSYGELPEKSPPGAVTLLNAMLAELDAHSALLGPEAYRELRQGTEGTFGGLGVLVGIRDNLLTVIKPLPHSPAQRAGIRRNDRILSIGGVFTYGFSLDDLVEYMRGEPGSRVQLSLLRPGSMAPSDISLKREVIHVDSVTTRELVQDDLKILHLTVDTFASSTAREVLTAIKKFRAKHRGSLHGLVLDLRSNPGGLLDQAVQVADLFLENGVIVTTKGRHDEIETAGSGFDEIGFPMVVLIDGDSASASEIVAGALQDHQRAVVVGQPSFGKGSVQTVFELPNERALKLTIARYFTPAGRSIQNIGIIPDVWVQPIAKADNNDNLFGPGRYKNERFLKNHLDAGDGSAAFSQKQPARKAYYLASASQKDDFDAGQKAPDRELELAVKILERVKATYGEHIPKSGARASHWLGLAGPAIKETVAKLDRDTIGWLSDKHKLKWDSGNQLTASVVPPLKLAINSSNKQVVTPGDSVNIAWTIVNSEKVAAHRVSLFARSEAPGIDTKELLVGEVEPASTKKGVVQITIPANFPTGPLALRIGLAVDAWPVRGSSADFSIQVEERPTARLSVLATLVEDYSGHIAGVLEPRENARVRLDLRNDGDVDAGELNVKLLNLSGNQLQMATDVVPIDELLAGDEKHIYFNVKAGKTMLSSELSFGVCVESADLRVPFRQRFAIKSLPSAEVSAKPIRALSH